MQQQEIKTLLPLVQKVVLAAGQIICEHAQRNVQIFHKGPIDLVTETDLAVEEYLFEELGKLAPGIAFMGEEGEAQKSQAAQAGLPAQTAQVHSLDNSTGLTGLTGSTGLSGLTWVVDPVDGTTNYAHNVPFVATSVGLWSGKEMLLGVVNCPLLSECFWAGRGLGAFGGVDYQGQCQFRQTKALKVSSAAKLSDTLLASGFPYNFEENLPLILQRLGKVLPLTQGMRRCGAAAIDLAYVAAGRFDAYYEEWIKPWDVAAGWLLVEEAGGRVGGLDGGPYAFSKNGIIATNGLVHEKLASVLFG